MASRTSSIEPFLYGLSTIARIEPSKAEEVNAMPIMSRELHLRTNMDFGPSPPTDGPWYDITVDVRGRRIPDDGGWLIFQGNLIMDKRKSVESKDLVHFVTVDVTAWGFHPLVCRQTPCGEGCLLL
ncbi:hypothetical protein MJO29_010764 [Puccinia striiformis f. sp. tritici]|uniref:Uncharacterized protein n=1 Tax=Puccinia striiformis f. sp. tritici PST-78 TaxID=1165861 RepID=A0A0L0W240_9BASI|nr:hypothetical protein Pst134EB_021520 [Puccinia striiformis f. sp. tritici]KAI7946237.1 hypothetical protein MJO29_010764 [Puccinia striiformis f. sp. tritici]KNF05608.1 hypothetical protein PSTG_01417 [Puccinia striiformis f. sp. tritici PST-78]